jgi:hypothetical protein
MVVSRLWSNTFGLISVLLVAYFLVRAADTSCLAAYFLRSRVRRCCGLSVVNPHVRHSRLDWLAPLVFRNVGSVSYVPLLRSTNPLNEHLVDALCMAKV